MLIITKGFFSHGYGWQNTKNYEPAALAAFEQCQLNFGNTDLAVTVYKTSWLEG